MHAVAERAQKLVETKSIRRVRTEAGVRRYKQPIGSIIVNDSLLVGLIDVRTNKDGSAVVKDPSGKHYNIRYHKGSRNWQVYQGDNGRGPLVLTTHNELEAYAQLAQRVQQEHGLEVRGGGLPGSGGNREGWSENQLEAANFHINGWGNTATDYGNSPLAYELWDIAGRMTDGHTPHRNARVARHELEQLKLRDDLELDRHLADNPDEQTFRELINNAIVDLRNETKLPKRYDAEEESAYAEEALRNAVESAGKPRPVKTSEISRGQWIRKVDADGKPQSDWFEVSSVGDQSRVAGRSRIIRGKTREGKDVTYLRQGPREKWETIGDPKNQPAYEPPAPPEKPFVSKRVHHVSKGDRIHYNGESGYMQDYMPDKDDYSSSERRKNPVYKLSISDDQQGKLNKRTIIVPKGTVFAPPSENADTPAASSMRRGPGWQEVESEYDGYSKFNLDNNEAVYMGVEGADAAFYDANDVELGRVPNTPASVSSWLNAHTNEKPSLTAEQSEYDGYEKYRTRGGEALYMAKERGFFVVYDANDNEVGRSRSRQGAMDIMQQRADGNDTPAAFQSSYAQWGNLRTASSEYDGYWKVEGRNGEAYYLAREGRTWTAYDKDDNSIVQSTSRDGLMQVLNLRAGEDDGGVQAQEVEDSSPSLQGGPALKRLKSKFDGWKRFKLPDGRVVDTGQATDDDNRWYATGKGGWEEIVADGDTEDEMMRKLRTMAGIEQPTSFSPSNTDVAPRRAQTVDAPAAREASPVMGMTREQYDRARARALNNPALRRAVLGEGAVPTRGRGTSGSTRLTREDFQGTAPGAVAAQDPEVQRRLDEEERRNNGGGSSALDDLRAAREAAAAVNERERIRSSAARANEIDIKPVDALEPVQPNHMPSEVAASVIGQEADYNADNRWSDGAVLRVREIRDRLRDGTINTPEAARRLRIAATSMETGPVVRHQDAADLRNLAQRITNYDNRSQADRQGEARGRAEARRAEIAQRADANFERTLPRGSKLRDLELGTAPVMRNGKPLKDADRKLLNLNADSNGVQKRLKDPNSVNLNDRRNRLAADDPEAMRALRDRATENYLNGMTHAAAWKEAIETAERIPVAEHYVEQQGTRDGYGQYVVYRRGEGMTREQVAVFRPKTTDRSGFQAQQAARGRMVQENRRARDAATRSVPVSGPVGATPAPESAPAAPTAVARGTGDARTDVEAAYRRLTPNERGYVDLVDLRRELGAMGYDRAAQDNAFRELEGREFSFEQDPYGFRVTPERRAASVSIGGEDRHMLRVNTPAPATATAPEAPVVNRRRDDPAYSRDYERGWSASQRNANLERADARGESDAYYDGFSDHRIGEPKWTSADLPERSANSRQARAAEDLVNNPLIDPQRASTGSIQGSRALDAMTYEERMRNLDPYVRTGPNYVRAAAEGYNAAWRKNERGLDYDLDLTEAEVAAGLRPREDVGKKRNASVRADMEWTANTVPSNVTAANLTEAQARILARSDPARFFRLVGERYFKQGKDFRKKENEQYRRAYEEMMSYADDLENAASLGVLTGEVDRVLMSIRVGHAGMMGIGQTMMTIRKVLKEEFGR